MGRIKRGLSILLCFALLISLGVTADAKEVLAAGGTEASEAVENQFIVVTNNSDKVEEAVDEKSEDEVVDTIHSDDTSYVVVETTEDLTQKMEEYDAESDVVTVQPNYVYSLMEEGTDLMATTNDPSLGSQWYLDGDIKIKNAWNYARSEKAVKVAVIDSGIQGDHPDLSSNINKSLSYDVINNTSAVTDSAGHGTHVAGIISGIANNKVGIAGVSYNVELLSFKVTRVINGKEQAASSDIINGYRRAVNSGARIINMSLGGYNSEDKAFEAEINNAAAKGIITICAGGNGIDGTPQTQKVYPGDYESCVSVVATDAGNGRNASFDYNEYKDIAAPGINIYSTLNYSRYGNGDGTSMAAPVVSGIVALMLTVEPNLSVDQIKNIMYTTAKDLGTAGKDVYYGNGLINAEACVKEAYKTTGTLSGKYSTGTKLFTDVPNNAPYIKYVRFVSTRGIMDGTTKGEIFSASAYMSRSYLTETLYKLHGSPSVTYKNQFPDVPDKAWFTNSVLWAHDNGIATGYESNKFGPSDLITREQMVTMLYRYVKDYRKLDVSKKQSLTAFADNNKVSGFAREAMEWSVANGIIKGDNGYIRPQRSASRAECATMITRLLLGYDI